jgi:hypothetical protein
VNGQDDEVVKVDFSRPEADVTDEVDKADLVWIKDVLWNQPDPELEEFSKLDREGKAAIAAEMGNLDPLREMFPCHAKFINYPKKWPRGKHRPELKLDGDSDYRRRLQAAYEDAKAIRTLARKHKRKLARNANWYAARFWRIEEQDLEDFHPSGEKKSAS